MSRSSQVWTALKEPSLPRAIVATALFGFIAAALEIALAASWPGNRVPLRYMAFLGLGLGWVAVKVADANAGYSGPILMLPIGAAVVVGMIIVAVSMGVGWLPHSVGTPIAFVSAGAAFVAAALGTIVVDIAR